jgi:hypothetical protein
MLKVQVFVFPHTSEAVQITGVTPMEACTGDGGTHDIVTAPAQQLVAVGSV